MIKSLEQLLAEEVKQRPYFVHPLLPIGGIMMLAGEPKSLKSFLAMNMSYDASDGTRLLLGKYSILRPLRVLYLDQELGFFRMRERTQLLHSGIDSYVAINNFFISSKDLAMQIDTLDGFKRLEDAVDLVKPDLLVLDPLWNFHSKDENKANEVRQVFYPLQKLLSDRQMAAILVHHTAKSTMYMGKPTRDPTDPSSMRGSTAMFGLADSIIMVEKPTKDETVVRLHFTLRDGPDPGYLTLKFNDKDNTFEVK